MCLNSFFNMQFLNHGIVFVLLVDDQEVFVRVTTLLTFNLTKIRIAKTHRLNLAYFCSLIRRHFTTSLTEASNSSCTWTVLWWKAMMLAPSGIMDLGLAEAASTLTGAIAFALAFLANQGTNDVSYKTISGS